MKKSACLALWLVLLLCASASAMELKEGFLGYRWGQDITKDKSFELKHTGGIIDYYVNTEKTYSISDVDAAEVVFGVIGNELYAVFVNIASEKGYQRAKDYLRYKFGNPKVKQQGQVIEYSWMLYDFTLRAKLKKNDTTGKMKMAFYYLPAAGKGPQLPEGLKEPPSFKWTEKYTTPDAIPLLDF